MFVRMIGLITFSGLVISLSASAAARQSRAAVDRIEIVDINNTLELRSKPRTNLPVCVIEAKNVVERRFVHRLRKDYSPVFDHKDWSNFGPDSEYRQIRLVSNGKVLTLQSWHPLYERDGRFVVTSHGVSSLDGRTRAEVLREGDRVYLARRTAFDAIVDQCLAHAKSRKNKARMERRL